MGGTSGGTSNLTGLFDPPAVAGGAVNEAASLAYDGSVSTSADRKAVGVEGAAAVSLSPGSPPTVATSDEIFSTVAPPTGSSRGFVDVGASREKNARDLFAELGLAGSAGDSPGEGGSAELAHPEPEPDATTPPVPAPSPSGPSSADDLISL